MIKIRKAKSSEWSIIQKLNNFVFLNDKKNDDDLDMNWPFSKKGIRYYKGLANGKYGHCLIAYLGKIAVGYVALAKKDFGYRKSKYIEIENIGVDPKYRSHGIGTKLVNAAIEWAKTKGAMKLWVSAYPQNKKAIIFYKKNHFYETGVELDRNIN